MILHRYIVLATDPKTGIRTAFESDYFNVDNHYSPEWKMVVIDLAKALITYDGKTWREIEEDHL